jgi:8-oxo-dGTP pyrophosphatase MutT (NUDIX family)
LAPVKYIASSRSIVFKDNSVLVVSQENGHLFILPGGTLESRESPLDALYREILEETGWTISNIRHIGFMHLHNLGGKPRGYKYPFPDSIWSIFVSEALEYKPEMKIYDKWVSGSDFHDIIEVEQLPIDTGELLLLNNVVKLRESEL